MVISERKYRKTKIERRSGVERRQTDLSDSIHFERRSGDDRRFIADRRMLRTQREMISTTKRNFLQSLIKKYTYKQISPPNRTARNIELLSEPDYFEFVERTSARRNCQVPVTIEELHAYTRHDATIYNFSRSGMYLESEHTPQIGTGALIYINNYSTSAPPPENLKKYFTQVIWMKKISGMVVFNRYGIGVKFCEDLEEFTRLFSY
jgi:hypothetical protein